MSTPIRKRFNRTEEVNQSNNQTQSQNQRQTKGKLQPKITDYKHDTQYKQYMVSHEHVKGAVLKCELECTATGYIDSILIHWWRGWPLF